MNKYQEAFDVVDTVLHLMCGEKDPKATNKWNNRVSNDYEGFEECK